MFVSSFHALLGSVSVRAGEIYRFEGVNKSSNAVKKIIVTYSSHRFFTVLHPVNTAGTEYYP